MNPMPSSATIHVLGSGSKGNALLLETAGTSVLIDAGFTEPELVRRLDGAGRTPDQIDAVLITHAHTDHYQPGTVRFCQRYAIPLYHCDKAERALISGAARLRTLRQKGLTHAFERGRPFSIGVLQVEAFELPHDASGGNVGLDIRFAANGQERRIAIATDLGTFFTEHLRHFVDADAIVLESNHDEQMLLESGRPATLIERILGDWGHLSNRQCAMALRAILERSRPGTVRHILLAHLSEECNLSELALRESRLALADSGHNLKLALTFQHKTATMSL